MAIEASEKEVEEVLKFRFLLAETCRDDLYIEGNLLVKLIEAYDAYEVRMPKPIKEFVRNESKRINKFLEKSIAQKKAKMEKLLLKRVDVIKKESKFTDYKESNLPERKVSRTEQIWGPVLDSGI